jgi:isoquinoline 1-oxidoreductase alpha subunit
MTQLKINGKEVSLTDIDPDMPLLWLLRDRLGLIGTKFGCGGGYCGACTVHVDGAPARSCSITVGAVDGQSVTTIEGLAARGTLHPLQEAWIAHDVPQCGYCQAGQIMSAAALLDVNPSPTDKDIDDAMAGNLCRCTTYWRIRTAIHAAAAMLRRSGLNPSSKSG